MGGAISHLIGLLPGTLAIEVALVFLGATLWRLVTPSVREAIDDGILHPALARYMDVVFRIVLPIAMMIWFVSIPVRFLWIR